MFGKKSAASCEKVSYFFFGLCSIYTFLCTDPVTVIYYSDQFVLVFTMKLDVCLENALGMY